MSERIAFPHVPTHLMESFEWLVKVDAFATARDLARTIHHFLPKEDPSTNDFLAYALFRCKRYEEAAEVAMATLAALPDSASAMFNAGKCLYYAGELEKAEEMARQGAALRPQWPDQRIELAVYVCAQGRADEARVLLENVQRELLPGDRNVDVVRFNLGWHEIRNGQFKQGMRDLAIGRRLCIWGADTHAYPRPRLPFGAKLEGKTVLLCGEGGAGDEIINVRFAQVIAARGGRCLWVTDNPIGSLFRGIPGLLSVYKRAEARQLSYDYWAPCMDLVQILGLDLDEIPAQRYLSPDPSYIDKWSQRIPPSGKLKIGIRWQGNPLYEQDLHRSVPFAALESLAQIPGVEVYSLQRDEGIEEMPAGSPVKNLAPQLETWHDTAAAIAQLDLVISSCTSIPHLAAAMGKPVWLLCPINSYYIWACPGDRSPWYENLSIFRQTRPRAWDEPMAAVKERLGVLANRPVAGGSGVRGIFRRFVEPRMRQ